MKFRNILDLLKAIKKNNIKTIPDEEVLQFVQQNNMSLIRWGDGETIIASGGDIYFQKGDEQLAKELNKIVDSYNERQYVLAIPVEYLNCPIYSLQLHELKIWYKTRAFFAKRINRQVCYANSLIFRDYMISKHLGAATIISGMCQDKKLAIVVTGNSINDQVFSQSGCKYISLLVPNKDAYTEYDRIIDSIKKVVLQENVDKKDAIIFLSCGPTAKVLAYNLSEYGLQCIDVGVLFNKSMIEKKYKIAVE